MLTDGRCNNPVAVAERMKSQINLAGESIVDESPAYFFSTISLPRIAYSQPMDMRMDLQSQMGNASRQHRGVVSFSQPVRTDNGMMSQSINMEDGFSSRVLEDSSSSPNGAFMEVFPSERITRFYSSQEPEVIYQRIAATLDQFLVPYRENQQFLKVFFWNLTTKIGFSTVDKRKCPISGEICVQTVGEDMCLVTFRKSRVSSILSIKQQLISQGRSTRVETVLSRNQGRTLWFGLSINRDRVHKIPRYVDGTRPLSCPFETCVHPDPSSSAKIQTVSPAVTVSSSWLSQR